ncbi:MAG: response regulator, partial [Terriglobales bacterium]
MPLNILLADKKLTAQKLGEKILEAAGHTVITVSNGAAAWKKITAEKPDVALLDVYMPGYSGLEVCEKIKNSSEMASTPVLLTVGKMEPFNDEDAQRVRADGVLIKPFEASDLEAAIRKIEERLAGAAAPPAPPAPAIEDESFAEWKETAEVQEEELPASSPDLQVPLDMASAPAFGMDMLSEEQPAASPARSTQEIVSPAAPARSTQEIVSPSAPARITRALEMTGEAEASFSEFPQMEAAPPQAALPVTPDPQVEFTSAPQAA